MTTYRKIPTFGDKVFIAINNFLELKNQNQYDFVKFITIKYIQNQFQYYRQRYDSWRNDDEINLSNAFLIERLSSIPWLYRLSQHEYYVQFDIDDFCPQSLTCTKQKCPKIHFYIRMCICGYSPDHCRRNRCGRYHVWDQRFRDNAASILLLLSDGKSLDEVNIINLNDFYSFYARYCKYLFPSHFFYTTYNNILRKNLIFYNKCGDDVLWKLKDDHVEVVPSKLIHYGCFHHLNSDKGCYISRYRSFKQIYKSPPKQNIFYHYHPTICAGIHFLKGLTYPCTFEKANKIFLKIGQSLHLLRPYLFHVLTSDTCWLEHTYKPVTLIDEDIDTVHRLEETFSLKYKQFKCKDNSIIFFNNISRQIQFLYEIDKKMDNGIHDGQQLFIIQAHYHSQLEISLFPLIQLTIDMFKKTAQYFNVDFYPFDVNIRNLHKCINIIYKITNYNDNILIIKSMGDEINRKYCFGRAVSIQSKILTVNDDESVDTLFQITNVNIMVSKLLIQEWFEDFICLIQQFYQQKICITRNLDLNNFQFIKSYTFWTIPSHKIDGEILGIQHQRLIEYHVTCFDEQWRQWMNLTFNNDIHFLNVTYKKNNIFTFKLDTIRLLHPLPPIIPDIQHRIDFNVDGNFKNNLKNDNEEERKFVNNDDEQEQGKGRQLMTITGARKQTNDFKNDNAEEQKIVYNDGEQAQVQSRDLVLYDENKAYQNMKKNDKVETNNVEGYLFKYDDEGNMKKKWFSLQGIKLCFDSKKIHLHGYEIINIHFKNAPYAVELIPQKSSTISRFILTPDVTLSNFKQKQLSDQWTNALRIASLQKENINLCKGFDIYNNNVICKKKKKTRSRRKKKNHPEEPTTIEYCSLCDKEASNNVGEIDHECAHKKRFYDNKILRHGRYAMMNLKHEQCAKRSAENDEKCKELGISLKHCRYCYSAEWSEDHAKKCLFMPAWVQETGAYKN